MEHVLQLGKHILSSNCSLGIGTLGECIEIFKHVCIFALHHTFQMLRALLIQLIFFLLSLDILEVFGEHVFLSCQLLDNDCLAFLCNMLWECRLWLRCFWCHLWFFLHRGFLLSCSRSLALLQSLCCI